jgi:hypothetical protein
MTTVQFPAASYANATAQALAVKAAGDAQVVITNSLTAAAATAAAVIAQVQLILPVS